MLVRTDKVAADEHPKTWADLMASKYKGKLVMADPSFTAIQLVVVATLSKNIGWQFYEALRKNDTLIVQGHEQIFDMVKRGERLVAAEASDPRIYTGGMMPANIIIIVPTKGAIQVPSPTAVIKGSPNPTGPGTRPWLGADDRVALWTVNTEPHDLSRGFRPAAELDDPLKDLANEFPAGAVNLKAALTRAVESFEGKAGRRRVVLFLGDGKSIAGPVGGEDRAKFCDEMVRRQITFFSGRPRLRIGRELDTMLALGTPGVGPGTTTWVT